MSAGVYVLVVQALQILQDPFEIHQQRQPAFDISGSPEATKSLLHSLLVWLVALVSGVVGKQESN